MHATFSLEEVLNVEIELSISRKTVNFSVALFLLTIGTAILE